MTLPLSVIVPCYNQGRFLMDCIESLEAQSFREFEIVLVDDKSTDGAWNVMFLLVKTAHERTKVPVNAYQMKERSGTAAALNAGIGEAVGEYITVVQADDLVERWHLAELMGHAAPERFVYGDLRMYARGIKGANLVMSGWSFERAKEKNLAHGAILFPRAAWEDAGGYPEVMADGREDWAMTLRLAAHGLEGYHIAQARPSYLYRQHEGNRSRRNHTPEWTARFAAQIREALPEVYG